jgi:hypothetical protein
MPIDLNQLRNPNFRFRQKEISLILDCWRTRQSVLLTGIRRTGKSLLQKEALYQFAKNGGRVGFLNVQDYISLHDFYRDILREMPASLVSATIDVLKSTKTLPDKLMVWLRGQVSSVAIPEIAEVQFQAPENLPRYWQPLVEAISSALANHPPETLPVLGIDELPFFLENLIKAGVSDTELTIALASLRKLRDAGLRMIIAGSISMENLLSLHGIPDTVLGGLFRLPIRPFSKDEARLYLKEYLAGKPADEESVISYTLETLPDYVPEFLKIAVQYLNPLRDSSEVAGIMENDVLPAIRRAFLQQFSERLAKNYLGDTLTTAEKILDVIAKAKPAGSRLNGVQLPTGYRRVLQMLQYDNFIIEGSDFRWVFSLQLLRTWWRAERGMP